MQIFSDSNNDQLSLFELEDIENNLADIRTSDNNSNYAVQIALQLVKSNKSQLI
jgi:hypothetical protein